MKRTYTCRVPNYIGSDRPYLDGERVMQLRVVAIFPYTTGPGLCFHLDTESGDRIVWFTKRRQTVQVGDDVRARFVIYKHQEYNGQRENVAKRFRILQNEKE